MRKPLNPQSRRKFLKHTSLTGLGAALGLGSSLPVFSENLIQKPLVAGEGQLKIKPRYHRWHVDPGVEWLEVNTTHATLDWSIPLSQTALVLLDVWQRHYIKETEERAEVIITEKYLPLLSSVRKAGMPVIHAPSPPVAVKHPNWVNLVSKVELNPSYDNWPPAQFINQTGPYKQYQRPVEVREAERQALPELTFHPKVMPLQNEAVVGNGEELHRYCKKNGILFLIYAGFNTNACILNRDYGTMQMSNRGYSVTLLRDCTTGMESRESQPTMAQTKNAILMLEMFGQYSLLSDELIRGLPSAAG